MKVPAMNPASSTHSATAIRGSAWPKVSQVVRNTTPVIASTAR